MSRDKIASSWDSFKSAQLSADNPYSYANLVKQQGKDFVDNWYTSYGSDNDLYALAENALNWEEAERLRQEDLEYNSEASKVARMRDAGLNPDLSGLQDASSTQSSPYLSDYQPQPQQSVMDSVSSGVGIVSQVLSSMSSLYGQFYDLKSMKNNIDAQELSNLSTASQSLEITTDDILSEFNDFDLPKYFQLNSKVKEAKDENDLRTILGADYDTWYELDDNFYTHLSRLYETRNLRASMLPKRLRDKSPWFSRKRQVSEADIRDAYYSSFGRMFKNREMFYRQNQADEDSFSNVMQIIVSELLSAEQNEAKYNSDYWNRYSQYGDFDAGVTHSGMKVQNEANQRYMNDTYQKTIDAALDRIMSRLREGIEQGDFWSILGALGVEFVRSQGGSLLTSLAGRLGRSPRKLQK